MKKSKYVVPSLLLCALTAFFMIFPYALDSYQSEKSARGVIMNQALVQNNQSYTNEQLYDFFLNQSYTLNETEVGGDKTEDEYIGECNDIFQSVYEDETDFCRYVKKHMSQSSGKVFTTLKLISIQNDEIMWRNIIICEFDGLKLCYEEQSRLPVFIVFNSKKLNGSLYKYLSDDKIKTSLFAELQTYYTAVGFNSPADGSYGGEVDMGDSITQKSFSSDTDMLFLGNDFARQLYDQLGAYIFL